MNEKIKNISLAKDFSRTPGARYKKLGVFSGELFREEHLEKYFSDDILSEYKLVIDLDGVEGYGTSFLEEVFGGLVRLFGRKAVKSKILLKAEILTFFKKKAEQYIDEAEEFINQ